MYNPTVTGEIIKSTNLLKVISKNVYRVMGIESVWIMFCQLGHRSVVSVSMQYYGSLFMLF